MKNKILTVISIFCITAIVSCIQGNKASANQENEANCEVAATVNPQPHRYGGWYCPDNLNGFPAVDIKNWEDVPVINGRMPTKEEAQNGTSLIFVDAEQYPNAKPLDITMPKLARFYCQSTEREELIIVIQAFNVTNDSIVGFRYLNGGNGSAHLKEVQFLTDQETAMIPKSRFVSQSISINANQDTIWTILTNPKNATILRPFFDKNKALKPDWRKTRNVNFAYKNTDNLTASYANKLYGCFYVQNDYNELGYTEKFLLLEDELLEKTELKIVCGPFLNDFEQQKEILNMWALKVKQLSEELAKNC